MSRKRVSAIYRSAYFRQYKAWLQTEMVACWVVEDGNRCYRRATIPDHDPPLCTVADASTWVGVLKPMCAFHSRRQSGLLRQGRNYQPEGTRQW